MTSRRLAPLVLVAAVVAASCSSDGSSSGADTTPRPIDTADAVAITAPATDAAVSDPATTEPVVPATEPPGLDNGRNTDTEPEVDPPPAQPALPALPVGYDGFTSELYADDANWMCLPGKADDVCARDLDATVVFADGSTEVEAFVRAEDPAVDCFYVYPTVSVDPGANSDLMPGEEEEISTVLNQAARLGAVCRMFAPVYRQRTLTALLGTVESDERTFTLAYDDVVDAFKHYIVNGSGGRPFVLVGHSQGAGILRELVATEIESEPLLLDRMVSALLLGTSVEPDGIGGIPPCTVLDDTSCVVSYASFRDTAPPPDNSFFARTSTGPALCVNPVDPAGGAAVTSPYFKVVSALLGGGTQPFDDPARTSEITTPFVKFPDMVTAECVDNGEFGYLELSITSADGDRVDDVGGDLTPEWGMHLIDANVAMGDLVALVARQSAAMTE